MLGLSKKQIQESIEIIKEFSELGDFLHQPVKMYSSGMKSRLGFSISINMEPDIMLIDEALSVGDSSFNEKCFNKIKELQEKGRTIFFVSHSINELRKYCTKGIWIEGGNLISQGDINTVCSEYVDFINNYKLKNARERAVARKEKFESRILKVEPETDKQRATRVFKKAFKTITIFAYWIVLAIIMILSLSN